MYICGLDEKRRKGNWNGKQRAENRERSLGFPGFVKPVFTKDSKPLGKRKRSLGHLGSVKPVLDYRYLGNTSYMNKRVCDADCLRFLQNGQAWLFLWKERSCVHSDRTTELIDRTVPFLQPSPQLVAYLNLDKDLPRSST
ncbi:hypothetical protein TNCV_443631 [Trichonephila clavipes]|nr:hypothetical protein TNCV_443631 [Trichonephila clavipes]